MQMKIYTKTGDNGTTSLINGGRVPKYHVRIEAYGTVDELNSYIGLVRSLPEIDNKTTLSLIQIQEHLMIISAILASEQNDNPIIPKLEPHYIEFLENEIDIMNETLPKMQSLVLPGGHITASHTHIARCICRRAERIVLLLFNEFEGNKLVNQYLNRLSDYLFVLGRKLGNDLKAKETFWRPE